jgi:LPS sulfotransferase NodH
MSSSDNRRSPASGETERSTGAEVGGAFEKNQELERLLARINEVLRAARPNLPEPPPSRFPLILLVGAPRTGTTLFMQWLQESGRIGVPTNLISRFYAAPAFGLMVQRLLFDPRYRYRSELDLESASSERFASDLGKTAGPLGHNSFFYFWRQYFPLTESARLADDELEKVDGPGLKRAIDSFAAELGTPLAMKGYLVQFHLRLLEAVLGRVLFVHLTREPVAVIHSILAARRRAVGREDRWWGCRPPGAAALAGREPVDQVAGQLALTQRSIRAELVEIPSAKQLEVSYEELCDRPSGVWELLRSRIVAQSENPQAAEEALGADYPGPASFRRSVRTIPDRESLAQAWEAFSRT